MEKKYFKVMVILPQEYESRVRLLRLAKNKELVANVRKCLCATIDSMYMDNKEEILKMIDKLD